MCSVLVWVLSAEKLGRDFMAAEIPAFETFPDVDAPSLQMYRRTAVIMLGASFLVNLIRLAFSMGGRYLGFFRYAAWAVRCFLCPGLVFQMSLLFLIVLGVHMLRNGTLEQSTIRATACALLAQGFAIPSVGQAIAQLETLLRDSSAKKDARDRRLGKETKSHQLQNLWAFCCAAQPPSLLVIGSLQTKGGIKSAVASVAATLHDRPADVYAAVADEDVLT